MASLSFDLEVRGSGVMENSDDSISLAKDFIGFNLNGFPELKINVDQDSASNQDVDLQIHGKNTIAQGGVATITFASITDAHGNVPSFAGIKYAIFVISSPDGLKALAIGPQTDANATAFGIAGTTTAANGKLTFKHFAILGEPVGGFSPGTKFIMTNVGTGSLDVCWWLVGEST